MPQFLTWLAMVLLATSAAGTEPADALKTVRIDLGHAVEFEMIRVEPGTFTIGSPPGEKDRRDNENQHAIRITKPFYLGKYEVTQAVWARVMTAEIVDSVAKANAHGFYWPLSDPTDITRDPHPSKFSDPRRPVDSVSWRQCKEFIARLNGLVNGGGFRLPTEAEWEYAARAGTTTPYFFGADASVLESYAWYQPNSGGTTHRVGSKRPNPWGFHDLYGNVWEWCEDQYVGPYPFQGTEALADYCNRGPEGGTTYQVVRGGSLAFSARLCRSASRSRFDPWQCASDIGFRLARTIEGH